MILRRKHRDEDFDGRNGQNVDHAAVNVEELRESVFELLLCLFGKLRLGREHHVEVDQVACIVYAVTYQSLYIYIYIYIYTHTHKHTHTHTHAYID